MGARDGEAASMLLAQLSSLRQHQHNGHRSPHKPLLVLLALGRLVATGSSELPWSVAEVALADLIAEFGQPSRTGRTQRAAYPFTRLRADGVWALDADVQMDLVRPLTERHVTGRLVSPLEAAFRANPELVQQVARDLVTSNFPDTVAPDVLEAVGLDPASVLGAADTLAGAGQVPGKRLRDPGWRSAVLQAWDRQCAFCGYDGQLAGASIGVEAAHVRWFAFDGPSTLDNGLALCVLHHKLFDIGVLGLDAKLRVLVSTAFTARTDAGRAVYDLHHRALSPRPGTPAPAPAHIAWHSREVFKAQPLTSSLPPSTGPNPHVSRDAMAYDPRMAFWDPVQPHHVRQVAAEYTNLARMNFLRDTDSAALGHTCSFSMARATTPRPSSASPTSTPRVVRLGPTTSAEGCTARLACWGHWASRS
jgi:putative restriction endonuclease